MNTIDLKPYLTYYAEELDHLNKQIWEFAELKFKETQSAHIMTSFLAQHGFQVESSVAGLPTAYIGTFGNGSPVIGILAEYDALSGMSQVADCLERKPRSSDGSNCGHGCGHNLLCVASIGAALAVKDYLLENKLMGTVKIIGCPGEEGGSGKAYMAREGVFDQLDVALTWHPASCNLVMSGSFLANIQVAFRFKGVSSHAAASPHLGRSALDAVELLNIGTNFLREHMEDSDRIHYAITNTGGISPNVVQAEAEVLYLIRSTTSEKASKLYDRVCKIAQGAALMTETEVEIIFDKACSNIIPNCTLEKVLYSSFTSAGIPTYSKEEQAYASAYQQTLSKSEIESDLALQFIKPIHSLYHHALEIAICDFIAPHHHITHTFPGSSDVGDVSWVVPTAQIMTACYALGTPAHSWQMVAQGTSPLAMKGALLAAEVLGLATIQLFSQPSLVIEAKKEHQEAVGINEYVCPIPDHIKPSI